MMSPPKNHERKQTWQGVVSFQFNFQLMDERERQQHLTKGRHVSMFVGVLLPNQGSQGHSDARWVFPRSRDVDWEVAWHLAKNFGQPVLAWCDLESREGATAIGAVKFLQLASKGGVDQPVAKPKPAASPPNGHPSS